eukprot:TRINITY_DN20284_c0_g1_i1.p1 TRINITY_DN20284_c0_g1~~TRINITY_DN20284_c0_g1_i1.p1  ORF type:complete len:792 (+),score=244.56 TRINITY_DN20284_c0_g1_i1:123-2498(+)
MSDEEERGRMLLVDNFDSYTYNLYQYLAEVCGAAPVVIKNDDPRGREAAFLEGFDGIVIGPGPGHPGTPTDIGISTTINEIYRKPVLGVCLGFQAMGLWNGGAICKSPQAIHGQIAPVEHGGTDPLFEGIPSGLRVVRYHSLIIDPATFPTDKIELTAATFEEGDGFRYDAPGGHWSVPHGAKAKRVIPMGLKVRGRPHWGVQYHPESVCTEYGHVLMANFAKICGVLDPTWRQTRHNPTATPQYRDLPYGGAERKTMATTTLRLAHLGLDSPDVFQELYGAAENVVWLDSSDPLGRGRYSVMADDSGAASFVVSFSVDRGLLAGEEHLQPLQKLTLDSNGSFSSRDARPCPKEDVLGALEHSLNDRARGFASTSALPFQGGFLGYLGYEMRGECARHAHGLTQSAADLGDAATALNMPDLFMIYTEQFLVVDHQEGLLYVCSVDDAREGAADAQCNIAAHAAWREATAAKIRALAERKTFVGCPAAAPATAPLQDRVAFIPTQKKAEYIGSIVRCQDLILEGETYEVCLTNEFEADVQIDDSLSFYSKLRVINGAPYGGYVRVAGYGDVCSSSPERFLKINSHGMCEAKPIKGTMKRCLDDPERDEELKAELKRSVKDQCENLMIADLLRNDLGMLSHPGTVKVPKLMDIESYKTVHQMVTTIQSVLPHHTSHTTVLKVTFPGGSIVGAPKVRTMDFIKDIEKRRRGIYTGSLGYLSLSGASDFNIAIRTAVISDNASGNRVLRIGAGGAITIQSDPESEWDEIMIKAYPLMRAVSKIVTGDECAFDVAL